MTTTTHECLFAENDIVVFTSPVRKVTFLFGKITVDGFIESLYGSNSDYLSGIGKFPYHTFDPALCRAADDKEKIKYLELAAINNNK